MEYNTTKLPIPVINKLNNKPKPSTYKSKLMPKGGIQFALCTTLSPDIVVEMIDIKYINKTTGIGNTNHPKCIRFCTRYTIGIMSANINGNNTAICIKLIILSSF